VHHNGRGLAGVYYYEIADQKVQESTSVARSHGYPLRLDLEQV
jgi:ATP-dependent Clp protease adaptor protein ClpS